MANSSQCGAAICRFQFSSPDRLAVMGSWLAGSVVASIVELDISEGIGSIRCYRSVLLYFKVQMVWFQDACINVELEAISNHGFERVAVFR